MRPCAKTAIGFCCLFALAATSGAMVTGPSENSYQPIITANVFHLRPPTPPPAPVKPTPPLPRVQLVGITTFNGKRALLHIFPAPGGNSHVKEESCVLLEGERFGDLEVLKIDARKGCVELACDGTPISVTFDKEPASAQPTHAPQVPPPYHQPAFRPPHRQAPPPVPGN